MSSIEKQWYLLLRAFLASLQSHHLLGLRRNCARKQLTTLGKHSARPPFPERCCETTTNYVMSVPHLVLCAIQCPSLPRPGNYFGFIIVTFHVEFILT